MNSRKFFHLVGVGSMCVLVITLSILLVSFNKAFYAFEFEYHGVHDSLEGIEVKEVNEGVLSYLKGQRNTLPPNFFNERETTHLKDVKVIFSIITFLFLFSLVYVIIYLSYTWRRSKNFSSNTSFLLKKSGFTILSIVGVLILLVLLNFSSSFSAFHHLFFEEGTYSFDPATENIVVLYPEVLFRDAALLIGGLTLLVAFFCIGASNYLNKNKKLFKKRR